MGDHFYSLQRGEGLNPNTVTAGTSSSGENVELRTRDGAQLNRKDVLLAIKTLEAYFQQSNPVTP